MTDGDRVTAGVNAIVERNIIDIEMTFPSSWGTITTELQVSLVPGICYSGISLGNVVELSHLRHSLRASHLGFCFWIFEIAIRKTSMPILWLATTNLIYFRPYFPLWPNQRFQSDLLQVIHKMTLPGTIIPLQINCKILLSKVEKRKQIVEAMFLFDWRICYSLLIVGRWAMMHNYWPPKTRKLFYS